MPHDGLSQGTNASSLRENWDKLCIYSPELVPAGSITTVDIAEVQSINGGGRGTVVRNRRKKNMNSRFLAWKIEYINILWFVFYSQMVLFSSNKKDGENKPLIQIFLFLLMTQET
jgi:hypothetical protein